MIVSRHDASDTPGGNRPQRKPAPQRRKPAPDSAVPPEDPASERGESGTRKPGRPRTWMLDADEPKISDPTITGEFLRGYLTNGDESPVTGPDGKPVPCIVRIASGKDGALAYSMVHIGDIRPVARHLAYDIASSRKLSNPEWSAYVTIRFSDRSGSVVTVDIAAGDLRQPVTKAKWIDRAGMAFSGRSTYVRDLIRILAMDLDVRYRINGQGPFWFDDGMPSCEFSKRLTFACKSLAFDTDNPTLPGIHTVIDKIPDSVNYYDLTPASEITEPEIREGCELFALAYDECPSYPSIPAAMIGQLMTGSIAAVVPACFSAILLTGRRGSGKSRYANRFDAIQARASDRTRGALSLMTPAVNIGDMRRSIRGPGYRFVHFGGFSITVDDVLKEGDSEFKIRDQSQIISDMIRSYEAGGGPLGKVDFGINEIVSSEAPSLHSSVRVMAEMPIEIESTLDRMIVLPHITASYGKNGAFNTGISERLSTGESREAMHRAYSAYVQWLFQRINTELDDCMEKARVETDTWNVPSRTQEKYATVIAGNYAFARFAEIHGIDLSSKIASAVTALRERAHEQATASVPLAEMFAKDLRAAIINRKVAFPGVPKQNDDGTESGMYGTPYRVRTYKDDSGIEHNERDEPFTHRQLGLSLTRDSAVPIPYPGARDYGFLMYPREDNGGHDGNPVTREWYLAIKKDSFAELCRAVSRDSRVYRPEDVIHSLIEDVKRGGRERVYMPDRVRAVIISAAWALTSGEDE